MDGVFEALVKAFLRAVVYIVGQIIFEVIFYYVGWPFVKVMTLGRYPKGHARNGWKSESYEGIWTSCVGVMVIAIGAVFFVTVS
ncbi:hypothetical protein ACUY1T_21365 [Billgrantia sp. Q4P2]